MYKCVNGLHRSLLIELLHLNTLRKNLRSDTEAKSRILWYNLLEVWNSSIKYPGPRLWDQIPQNIMKQKTLGQFKILLKTYLFRKYYNY